ncbi:MAG: hypothetical protein ACREQY_23980, partial [Candidatus Binatia bacterium]
MESLAGLDCLPIVRRQKGSSFFERQNDRLCLTLAQMKVIRDAGDTAPTRDRLDSDAPLTDPRPNEKLVWTRPPTDTLAFYCSRDHDVASETVEEKVEKIRLGQQNQRRGIKYQHDD